MYLTILLFFICILFLKQKVRTYLVTTIIYFLKVKKKNVTMVEYGLRSWLGLHPGLGSGLSLGTKLGLI